MSMTLMCLFLIKSVFFDLPPPLLIGYCGNTWGSLFNLCSEAGLRWRRSYLIVTWGYSSLLWFHIVGISCFLGLTLAYLRTNYWMTMGHMYQVLTLVSNIKKLETGSAFLGLLPMTVQMPVSSSLWPRRKMVLLGGKRSSVVVRTSSFVCYSILYVNYQKLSEPSCWVGDLSLAPGSLDFLLRGGL